MQPKRAHLHYGVLCTSVLIVLLLAAPAFAMSGGAHALSGAAIGQATGSPMGAFVAGLASHTLLDSVPHYSYGLATEVLLLVGAGLIVQQQYEQTGDIRIVAGAAGGFLPDVEHVLGELGLLKNKHFPSHSGVLPHNRTRNIWQGLWLEAGTVGALVGLAF